MVGSAPKSAPLNATWTAFGRTPAARSTSASRTPVQREQLMPPLAGHGVPRGSGL
jgi:hypothetical protein